MVTVTARAYRFLTARCSEFRLLVLGVGALLCVAATAAPARADTNGFYVGVQGADTFMQQGATIVNNDGLKLLRKYVPSAPSFNLDRPEFLTSLGYEHTFGQHLILRVYAGYQGQSATPVYKYTGEGNLGEFPIGQVETVLTTQGNMLTGGADLLYRLALGRSPLDFVVGGGVAGIWFDGNIVADFIPLLLGNTPFDTIHAAYWGGGALGDALTGLRLEVARIPVVGKVPFFKQMNLMLMGGYRAGISSMSINVDVKGDSGKFLMPIYGPLGQLSLGWQF